MKNIKIQLAVLLLSLAAVCLSACGEEATPTKISQPTSSPNLKPSPTFNSTERVTLPPFAPTLPPTPFPTLAQNASEEARLLATIAVSRGQGQPLAPTSTNAAGLTTPRPAQGVTQPKVVRIEADNFRPQIEFTEVPTLADGVPVLINFDSAWCSFCSQTQPMVSNLKTKFAAQIRFANLNFNDTSSQSFIQRYGITSAPSILLVDKTGVGRRLWVGLLPPGELEQALKDIVTSP